MDQKIIDLEERITHLEHDVESLNQVIFRQRQELDEFQLLLKHLSNQLKTLEDKQGAGAATVSDEKPPHYWLITIQYWRLKL